jgi:hypothetical protein
VRSKSWRFVMFTAASALLAFWIALPSLAQMHRGGPGLMRMYNPATEVTLKGSVEAVNQVKGPQGWGGTHLSLKTEKETIDVHVGPSWFLAQNKVSFAKGDQVEVTGSRVKFGDQDALIAREINKGSETLTLRNTQGFPVWAGGHHRPIS